MHIIVYKGKRYTIKGANYSGIGILIILAEEMAEFQLCKLSERTKVRK